MARRCGWQPLGTTPDPLSAHHWGDSRGFPGNYDCDERGKVVSANDAAALADALETALASTKPLPAITNRPVLIREGMTGVQCRQANADLGSDLLAEFIDFLRKGQFSFFWDD
ncbi:MAG: hypothetical protein ACJ74Z_01460 [Bryobacteraceae bacterium]